MMLLSVNMKTKRLINFGFSKKFSIKNCNNPTLDSNNIDALVTCFRFATAQTN